MSQIVTALQKEIQTKEYELEQLKTALGILSGQNAPKNGHARKKGGGVPVSQWNIPKTCPFGDGNKTGGSKFSFACEKHKTDPQRKAKYAKWKKENAR